MNITTILKRLCLLLMSLFGASYCASAQSEHNPFVRTEEWRWVRFSPASGLPNSRITEMIEISDSCVFALTQDGLYVYNGFSWESVDSVKGLPRELPRKIFRMAGDTIGVLCGNQIYYGAGLDFRRLPLVFPKKNYKIDDVVYSESGLICALDYENSKTFTFYLCSNGQARQLEVPRLSAKEGYFVNQRRYLFSGGQGAAWLNAAEGLYRFSGGKWELRFRHERRFSHTAFVIERGANVYFYLTDWDFNRGFWRLHGTTARYTAIGRYLAPLSADVSPGGEIAIAYTNGTIHYFNTRSWSLLSPREDELNGLMFVHYRRTGDWWLQTPRCLSLYKSSARRWTYLDYGYQRTNNHINEIFLARDSTLWVATGTGLYSYRPDGRSRRFSSVYGKELAAITGIAEDSAGNIWVSSGTSQAGVYRWDGSSWKNIGQDEGMPPLPVHKIRSDRSGRLWFLTLKAGSWVEGGGAYLYSKGKFIRYSTKEGLLHDRVYSFAEDKEGSFWFGTLAGISRLRNGVWKHWPNPANSQGKIFALTADSINNCVWFSRFGKSFGYIRNDSLVMVPFQNANRLPVAVVDLQTDRHGRLWIATQNDGLILYKDGLFSQWDASDGLLSQNLWPLLVTPDKVYIGTMGRGMHILSLEEERHPRPRVFFGRPRIEDNSVAVSWTPFSWWSRRPSENIETRYRINGAAWSEWSRNHKASMLELSPGLYTVEVQAKGLFAAADHPGSVSFVIPAPYYMSWYFRIPVLIAGLLICWLVAALIFRKKKYNDELRSINAELEQKVRDRTQDLVQANEQLLSEISMRTKVQEELALALAKEKELGELKLRFVSLVSHEFRTPLSVIQSSAEIIERYEDKLTGEEKRKFYGRINDSIQHITDLMNDVLFVGQTQSGRLQFSPEDIRLQEFCLRIIDEFTPGTGSCGPDPRISFEFGAGEEYRLDRKLMRTILMNLLSNALKYSPADRKVILSVEQDADILRLTVHDDGIGIPAEDIPRIFDAFYRSENAENIQGTGLGMTIVKDCVELHGGRISVNSSDEDGTNFVVELPVVPVEEEHTAV